MANIHQAKIVFFGQDWRSAIVLKQLISTTKIKIIAVVTLPGKSQGRKKEILANPIQKLSNDKSLKIINFDNHLLALLKNLELPQIGVLASFGAKIPPEIINFFPKGILVIHPSLLPKYRGVSPVQSAILDNQKETGLTIFKMDSKFDHGPIINQLKEPIATDDTSEILFKKLFSEAVVTLIKILPSYLEGKIKSRPQNEKLATYTKKLTSADALINWQKPAQQIYNQIRALTPWPGTFTKIQLKSKNGRIIKRLKILTAHLEKSKLILDQVQLEGKKPVSWQQFCQGYPQVKILK